MQDLIFHISDLNLIVRSFENNYIFFISQNTAGIEGSLNQQSVGSGVSPSSAGGHGGEEPRPHSNIFQIPPSQDILAGPNHLSLGLGGSQSIGQPCVFVSHILAKLSGPICMWSLL